MGRHAIRRRTVGILLGASLSTVACGGGAEKGEQKEAPATEATAKDGIQTSWNGFASKTYDGDLAFVLAATQDALKTLHLEVIEDSADIFRHRLEAESSDGTELVVDLGEVTKSKTHVRIKVGYFLGDDIAARRIHSEIEDEMARRVGKGERAVKPWSGFGAAPAPTRGGKER